MGPRVKNAINMGVAVILSGVMIFFIVSLIAAGLYKEDQENREHTRYDTNATWELSNGAVWYRWYETGSGTSSASNWKSCLNTDCPYFLRRTGWLRAEAVGLTLMCGRNYTLVTDPRKLNQTALIDPLSESVTTTISLIASGIDFEGCAHKRGWEVFVVDGGKGFRYSPLYGPFNLNSSLIPEIVYNKTLCG